MRIAAIIPAIAASVLCGEPAQPTFDVVSIKPGGDVFSVKPERTPGRLRWTTQLAYLIGYAYDLDSSRVSCRGACSEVYTVDAVFDTATTEDQVRLMVQSTLKDRFKMRAHRDVKEVEGFALVMGKNGVKIRAANEDEAPPPLPPWIKDYSTLRAQTFIAATSVDRGVIGITGRRATMAQLVTTLGRLMDKALWDRTGLTGSFYFAFRYKQDATADVDTDAPVLSTALEESLGLRLEKGKGPLETLVIDSVEAPSGN